MFLDGLTYGAVLVFCLFHVLPEAIVSRTYLALPVFILGLFFPTCPNFFYKRFNVRNKQTVSLGLWLVVTLGFALHVFMEGTVIATQSSFAQLNVGLSVIVHRFGVGVILLNFFLTQFHSKKYGYAVMALLIFGTVAGYFMGSHFNLHSHSGGLHLIEVFVAGNLLHFVSHASLFGGGHGHEECCDHDHDHHYDHDHGHAAHDHAQVHSAVKKKSLFSELYSETSFSSYGAMAVFSLLVLEVLYFSDHAFQSQIASVGKTFLHLLAESAMPLLLAFAFAGIFKGFIRPAHLKWLEHGSRMKQTAKGVAFGIPLPICSCGVLPLYQSLIKKGVPLPAAIGFLIATPEIGVDAIFLSIALLGEDFTVVRLASAFVLAFFVAISFSYIFKFKKKMTRDEEKEPSLSFKERLQSGMKYGFVDLVDHTVPWILFGILIASFMEHFVSFELFQNLSSWQHIVILTLVGIPFYVCASGATPLAAILLHKGVSGGTVVAFLLAGPATNVSTFGILGKLHGKKFAALFGVGVIAVAIAIGLFVDSLNLSFSQISHSDISEEPTILQWISTSALTLIILYSFLRQGLRHFLEQLYNSNHAH